MREAFVSALHRLAASDPSVILLTGDLGFGVLDSYARELPGQYVNVGVAEQNMAGLAVGMALSGRKVFTYSIANFPTLRCLEQIRNDICYHDADVTIVAIGGGLSYGPLGFSHHATEDLAIMRALPGMKVVAPGDDFDAAEATDLLASVKGPAYLRLDRSAPPVAGLKRRRLGFAELSPVTVSGHDVLLVSTGSMLRASHAAALRLAAEGVGVTHLSSPWVKPFDESGLVNVLARGYRLVVTVEEHSIIGGLGSTVAEVVTSPGKSVAPVPVLRCGLPDVLPSIVGSQTYLRARFGLESESITRRVLRFLAQGAEAGTEL
jgi:transketolase